MSRQFSYSLTGGGIFFTLDDAYNDGSTITADAGAMTLTNSTSGILEEIISTDTGNTGAILSLYHNSASAANDDELGRLGFYGMNNAGTPAKVNYAYMNATSADITAGAEFGRFEFYAQNGTAALARCGYISHNGTSGTFSIGDGTGSGILESGGNTDLVLQTGGPVATSDVTITNAANGNITANLDGTGTFVVSGDGTTTSVAASLTADGLTSGTGLLLESTSTAGLATNNTKMLQITRSGANAGATHVAYGVHATITNTGTTNTNVGGYFSASGGSTANYGIQVAAGLGQFDGTGVTISDGLLSVTSSGTTTDVVAITANSTTTGSLLNAAFSGAGDANTRVHSKFDTEFSSGTQSATATSIRGKMDYTGAAVNNTFCDAVKGEFKNDTTAASFGGAGVNGVASVSTGIANGTVTVLAGASGGFTHNGTGIVTNGVSVLAQMDFGTTGTTTAAIAYATSFNDSSGGTHTWGEFKGLDIVAMSIASTGGSRGVVVNAITDTGTLNVGVDVAAVSGGTDNLGIRNAGAYAATPDEITATAGGVAASLLTEATEITTDGGAALDSVTLANGYSGQIKRFIVVAVGNAGDSVDITPATMVGGTQITFAANPIGLGCIMQYADNEGWVVVANNGGTIA